MALDTYTGLKASVADWLNRADLTAAIPDFISMAEANFGAEFAKGLRAGKPVPRQLHSRSDVTIVNGDEYISLPVRFQSPISFVLLGDPIIVLDYLDPTTFLAMKQANQLDGEPPAYYTVVGEELQIYPPADAAYTGEMFFVSRVEPLSGTNASNWVLEEHPGIYLYGALMQAAMYLKDDTRLPGWASMFATAISGACASNPMPTNKAKLKSGIPVVPRSAYNISTDI